MYVLYPEQESHLNITVETLADNGIKFRIKREYHDFYSNSSLPEHRKQADNLKHQVQALFEEG